MGKFEGTTKTRVYFITDLIWELMVMPSYEFWMLWISFFRCQ